MFILALLFGVGQVILTAQLIYFFNKKENKKLLMFLGLKFVLYMIGIALVIFAFIWNIGMAIGGFLAGVSITAIAIYIYKTMYKK